MKLSYETKKKSRFKKMHFMYVTPSYGGYLWYFHNIGIFLNYSFGTLIRGDINTYTECTNVRKFRRILRKMSGFVESGEKFKLYSKYNIYDVYGKIK